MLRFISKRQSPKQTKLLFLEDCSVPSEVLMVLVSHFPFPDLGISVPRGKVWPPSSTQFRWAWPGAGLHLPCQSCFCSLCSLTGESGDKVVCSCAPLINPRPNLHKEISVNFPKLSKGNPKKDLCGKTLGKFSIHQKACFVRQTQCSKSSYIALLSSKLLLLCYGNLVC